MKSKELKAKLLHYYRFRRRYKYIATEAGVWNSDVLVSDENEIIEIEVKISLSDYLKDFSKNKHNVYKAPSKYYKTFLPNKFYFCVPENLAAEILPLLKDSKYGLLVCLEGKITKKGSFIKCVKKAENISDSISKKLLHALQLRMGSELIRMKLKELDDGPGKSKQRNK